MNWLEEENTTLRTSLDGLRDMTSEDFPVEQPLRVDVATPDVTIPLLVVKREHADRLTVLNNGAMDLKRSQGKPIFQRSSWWQDINSHQIYVCDPGTIGENAVSINWFQSSPPIWNTAYLSRAIRHISKQLGVTNARGRRYFGSSAGGFAALLQLCADKNASCIINNSQFDWTRWFPNDVKTILNLHFNGRTASEVRRLWPHRSNVLEFLAMNLKPLRIDYFVNVASSYDKEIQLPIFEKFLTEHPQICGLVSIHRYYSEGEGHNPMSPSKTLGILNRQF